MADLDFLIIDNDERWQRALRDVMPQLGGAMEISVATSYAEAVRQISIQKFDLATLDLSLLSDPDDRARADEKGMELAGRIRESSLNRGCALIVLTGYPTTTTMRRAWREYHVHDYIEKDKFDPESFLTVVRDAILFERWRQAETELSRSYHLDISLGQERLLGSELRGPARRSSYTVTESPVIEVSNLIRRADNLDLLVRRGGADLWRPEANDLGQAVYRILAGEQQIWGDFRAAQGLVETSSDLWLQFKGPAQTLGIPFELMRDENDYFGHAHVITRSLIQPASVLSRKVNPFHTFTQTLKQQQKMLRVLVIGANADGLIPAVEVEALNLKDSFEVDLQCLGIDHEVVSLTGSEANYDNVRGVLGEGRFHLLHFAGHGRFNSTIPEGGGIVLPSASGPRAITAAELNLLTRDTELQMVYLSCCLGARTAHDSNRGDFYGIVEALSRADVPIVLGHRWSVADTPAQLMAQSFYKHLWRTFLPSISLLQARRTMLHKLGRDDHTWAAPLLIMQNA